ncbi:MAG: hypothetical protein IJ289_02090 [Clostridia bacterium]|nr:hypothetical protein [Clostridia bacterium]
MKKITALLLSLIIVFSFSGCFSLPDDYVEKDNSVEEIESEKKDNDDDNGKKENDADASLESELIFSFNEKLEYVGDEALVYVKDDKYGIITSDGDILDAEYTDYIALQDDHFNVSRKVVTDYNNPANVNVTGVINKKGEMVVPEKYYGAEALNDRLFVVYTVDGIVTDKEQAVTYRSESGDQYDFSYPSDGDTLYSGKWEIYDAKVNAVIPGLSGTKMDDISAHGNVIDVNWEKEYFVDGSELSEDIIVYSNGCYEDRSNKEKYIMYDENSVKLFEYNHDEIRISGPFWSSPDYFSVYDDSHKYYVMDKSGNIISEAFSEYISDLYLDKYVAIEKNSCYQVFDFDGNEIIAPTYTNIDVDEIFGVEILLMSNGTEYAYMDADGKMLASTPADEEYEVSEMVIAKKNNNIKDCFNVSTGKFDLEHTSPMWLPWCVETSQESNGIKYGAADILSGKELVECKYNKLYVFGDRIVAYDAVDADNSYDVYQITAK